MPPSITPLNARSQTLITVLLSIMAVLIVMPFVDDFIATWPPRFGELRWSYDMLGTILVTTPQAIVLTSVVAIVGVMTGNREAVRATAVVFGCFVALQVIVAPLLLLDYLQVRHMLASSQVVGQKVLVIRSLLVAMGLTVGAALAAYAAWRASEREGAGSRRKKGEGLVVGQPKEPRPPT